MYGIEFVILLVNHLVEFVFQKDVILFFVDVNLHVFNMIRRRNEAKILAKHFSYDCKCKMKSNQKWSKDKCRCNFKNFIKHRVCKKDYGWNPSTCAYEINKFSKSSTYMKILFYDSVITCDEIIATLEIMSINSNNNKKTYKMDY